MAEFWDMLAPTDELVAGSRPVSHPPPNPPSRMTVRSPPDCGSPGSPAPFSPAAGSSVPPAPLPSSPPFAPQAAEKSVSAKSTAAPLTTPLGFREKDFTTYLLIFFDQNSDPYARISRGKC